MNPDQIPPLALLAQEPLGLYLRPGRSDHTLAGQLFSESYAHVSGVVFDPTYADVQERLRDDVRARKLWAVVDPKAMELASPGGFQGKRTKLPWAGDHMHTPDQLSGLGASILVNAIVEYVGKHGFDAVLAPTHFLENGADDIWFPVDRQLVFALRNRLDSAGLDR